jgi:class 3 adenylate cyclase
MPKIPAFLKEFLRVDYALVRDYMGFTSLIGSLAYIAFHFFEASLGYRDAWWLRAVCVLLPLPIVFFPRQGALGWRRLFHWELALFVLLPFSQTYLYFLNAPDAYWTGSLMLAGLAIGLLTRPLWLVPQLALGALAGLALYALFHGLPDPERLRIFTGMQFNVGLMGLLALAIQSGLQVFHRRGLALAAAQAQTLEARKREAEITAAYEELRRREMVITRFVRPSLFEELSRGRDPTEFEPVEKDLAILFCDIRDFTALTEVLGAKDKQSFLNEYFAMMTRPIVRNGGEVDKIMGDCVMGIFPDGRSAVLAAVHMRLQLQEFNRRMFAEGKPRIRNGIGIAKGPVLLGNFGSHEKLDRTVIGEAVNIAARLESKTKLYDVEVVVTEDVTRDLASEDAHFRWIDVVQVKGSSRRIRVYEVYTHQPAEVRRYKDATRDLLEKALTIYFRKGFRDALRLFQAMLAEVPPHRLVPGGLMDNILRYYIEHCQAWANGDPETWNLIQKWEGVHVFHDK